MNYKVFFQNKVVDISTQRINTFLVISNIRDIGFKLEWHSIANEDFLNELSGSPNVGLNAK